LHKILGIDLLSRSERYSTIGAKALRF